MNFLERSAIRRAERQLRHSFEPGEEVLEFDINMRGDRIDCIATNYALYLVPRGGAALRIPYETIMGTQGDPSWLGFTTFSGNEYLLDFGRSSRGLSSVVVEQYKAVAQKRRHFSVSWGSGGARFLVVPTKDGDKVESWTLAEGTADSVHTSMLVEQALGELEVALGQAPSLQYADPRPSFMSDFEWDPSLPA